MLKIWTFREGRGKIVHKLQMVIFWKPRHLALVFSVWGVKSLTFKNFSLSQERGFSPLIDFSILNEATQILFWWLLWLGVLDKSLKTNSIHTIFKRRFWFFSLQAKSVYLLRPWWWPQQREGSGFVQTNHSCYSQFSWMNRYFLNGCKSGFVQAIMSNGF